MRRIRAADATQPRRVPHGATKPEACLAIHVLGISGSPRETGATSRLVQAALLGATAVPGTTSEYVSLAGKALGVSATEVLG